jgi:hypothetical protein
MTEKKDRTEMVLKRISDANFYVLRDSKGIALNVAYTEGGLEWTTDNLGRKLWGKEGTYVEIFKPTKEVLFQTSFKAKCEKRWVDKANAMLYEQRG